MAEHIDRDTARNPEDIPRLFLAFAKAGDFAGLATLYEDDAILARPSGEPVSGSEAIAAAFAERLGARGGFDDTGNELLPVLRCGDLALTSTRLPDGRTTAEIARRQADGTWRWVIDQPDVRG